MKVVVIGIHTGIGKTFCSTVMVEALKADYWKPIQAGDLDQSDTLFVKAHTASANRRFHPEAYRLNTPASPHYAAQLDGISIALENVHVPETENHLIIETAGGLMSPINESQTVLDLVKHLNLPVILVVGYYLGSINHTMLTLNVLQQHQIPLLGLAFSGHEVAHSKSFILQNCKAPELFSLPFVEEVNTAAVQQLAQHIKPVLETHFV